jgi:hypothetical protein
VVCSDDEVLMYFELGTIHQQARSVLGVAAVHETDRVADYGRANSSRIGASRPPVSAHHCGVT